MVLSLTLVGCGDVYSWHQKLTVTVETPEGLATGSAVAEVRWNDSNAVGNFPGSYRGEATVVDLGAGRYLFALLGEGTRYRALHTFNGNAGISEEIFAAMERVRGTRPVPADARPLLVTFGDIADPASVRRVEPNDLAATFGPGYRLRSITLEITGEPVTKGRVETVLPWLEAIGRERATFIPNPPRLSTQLTDPEIQLLSSDSFSTELYK